MHCLGSCADWMRCGESVSDGNKAGEIAVASGGRAGKKALNRYSYGIASVRFTCGSRKGIGRSRRASRRSSGWKDTVLYSFCFDANGSLFDTILGEQDAIISDALNYASRAPLQAKGFRYANNDMGALEEELQKAEGRSRRNEAKPSDIPNREVRNPSGM